MYRTIFPRTDEMAGVIQICQVVDGLPLALEMAATWTKMMTCADIAANHPTLFDFLRNQIPGRSSATP